MQGWMVLHPVTSMRDCAVVYFGVVKWTSAYFIKNGCDKSAECIFAACCLDSFFWYFKIVCRPVDRGITQDATFVLNNTWRVNLLPLSDWADTCATVTDLRYQVKSWFDDEASRCCVCPCDIDWISVVPPSLLADIPANFTAVAWYARCGAIIGVAELMSTVRG